MAAPAWNWEPPLARLAAEKIAGTIDASQPARGLHALAINQQQLAGSVLGVTMRAAENTTAALDLSLREAYVRGDDLVANYQPNPEWPLRVTAYWQFDSAVAEQPLRAGVLLTVSVETDLLDTHPLIEVASELGAPEVELMHVVEDAAAIVERLVGKTVVRDAATLVLYRWPSHGMSYAEMTHPSDFRWLKVSRSEQGNLRAEWQLFGQFLEKGVIRRARMRGVWLPREEDVQRAAECYRHFAQSKIPLTT
jgi:hypothetical protein